MKNPGLRKLMAALCVGVAVFLNADPAASASKPAKAKDADKKPAAKVEPAPAPAPLPPPPPTPIGRGIAGVDALMQWSARVGIKTCQPELDRLTRSLGAATQVGGQPFAAPEFPDMALYSTSMEVLNGQVPSYVTLDVAPVVAGHCGYSYNAITYWPDVCRQVEVAFNPMQLQGILSSQVEVLWDPKSPLLRVYLMPAGPGCISIKKEVQF